MTSFDIRAVDRQMREAGADMDAFYADLGIHRTTWQRWLRGIGEPRLSVIQKIEALRAEDAAA